jgi:hypothetical protein
MPVIPTFSTADDLQDLAKWNHLTKAILERAAARGSLYTPGNTFGSILPTPFALADGADVSWASSIWGVGFFGAAQFWTIRDMQTVLQTLISDYFKDGEHPSGWTGINAITSTTNPIWTWDSMCDELGRPNDITGITVLNRLWRRKKPRVINSLSATKSYDSAFPSIPLGDCVAGDKAQYFASGTYKGVYQYQGGGVWTPSPGSVADVMDSQEEYLSSKWICPASFQIGDYFAPHLLEDCAAVCRRLNWSAKGIVCYTATTSGVADKFLQKEGTSYEGTDPGDPGTGDETVALAAMIASTPIERVFGASGWPGRHTVHVFQPEFSGGYDRDSYWARSDHFAFGLPRIWKGIERTIEYYVQPVAAFGGTAFGSTFHAQGSGLTEGAYQLFKTKTLSASDDDYELDLEEGWAGYPEPTHWAISEWPGTFVGFQLRYMQAIVKWDFEYTA